MKKVKTVLDDGRQVRFRTVNVLKNGENSGRVITATVNTDDTKTEFYAGFAFCSSKEKYDKNKGKHIAAGRALCERTRYIIYKEDGERMSELIKNIIPFVAYANSIHWLKPCIDEDTQNIKLKAPILLV